MKSRIKGLEKYTATLRRDNNVERSRRVTHAIIKAQRELNASAPDLKYIRRQLDKA